MPLCRIFLCMRYASRHAYLIFASCSISNASEPAPRPFVFNILNMDFCPFVVGKPIEWPWRLNLQSSRQRLGVLGIINLVVTVELGEFCNHCLKPDHADILWLLQRSSIHSSRISLPLLSFCKAKRSSALIGANRRSILTRSCVGSNILSIKNYPSKRLMQGSPWNIAKMAKLHIEPE